jgi:hypothetical protein
MVLRLYTHTLYSYYHLQCLNYCLYFSASAAAASQLSLSVAESQPSFNGGFPKTPKTVSANALPSYISVAVATSERSVVTVETHC